MRKKSKIAKNQKSLEKINQPNRAATDELLLVETGFHYNPRGRCITKLVRFITNATLPRKSNSLFFIAGQTKKHPKTAKTTEKTWFLTNYKID